MARETRSVTRTLRMTLAYDGTNYCGWQIQPNGVSLQEIVERALSQFTREPIRATASGRTDAGVHAIGQVISFETRSTAPCSGFLNGMGPFLPADVVVRAVEEAASGFNARYDAKRKWYRYVIHNNPVRLPFLRTYALWQRNRLDDEDMNRAAEVLLGTHDFRCFETKWPNRSSSVRTVFRSSVIRVRDWPAWDNSPVSEECFTSNSAECPFVCFDIEADGFLYNMVRAILGTLIHVGRGRWSPDDVRRMIDLGDRSLAGETAPAHGLYLMKVDYDDPVETL